MVTDKYPIGPIGPNRLNPIGPIGPNRLNPIGPNRLNLPSPLHFPIFLLSLSAIIYVRANN